MVFIGGCIRSQQQTLYRHLHCHSLVCFIDRRNEAAEAAGRIAKSSLAILPPLPEQKERILFTSVTMGVAFVRISKQQKKSPTLCFA